MPGTDLRAGVVDPAAAPPARDGGDGCRRGRPARAPRARRARHRRLPSSTPTRSREPTRSPSAAIAALREHAVTARNPRRGAPLGPRRRRRPRPAARRLGQEGAHPLRRDHRRALQLDPKDDPMTKLRLAIVGAGPAGIYAADILLKAENATSTSRSTCSTHLPAPYGLVRYGVAPDHPRIKGIINALRDVLDRGDIRLFGNVRFGTDITLDDLKQHYNAVIFATGAIRDADLDIPGIELEGSLRRRRVRQLVRRAPRLPAQLAARGASRSPSSATATSPSTSRACSPSTPTTCCVTEIPDNVYEGLKASPGHRCARLRPPRPDLGEVHPARTARARRAARRRHDRLRRGLRLRRRGPRRGRRATSRSS